VKEQALASFRGKGNYYKRKYLQAIFTCILPTVGLKPFREPLICMSTSEQPSGVCESRLKPEYWV
jgi:hypothetical protein